MYASSTGADVLLVADTIMSETDQEDSACDVGLCL